MQTLQGIVNKIRFSTEVSGGKEATSTSHIAIFEIENMPIELKLPDSIILENGNEALVAGDIKKGVFKAIAYKNLTNNASGKGPVISSMLGGIFFTLFGLVLIPEGIGLLFTPFGIYFIWYSLKLSKAYKLVISGP